MASKTNIETRGVPADRARLILTGVWFGGGVVCFIILLAQSIGQFYIGADENRTAEAWFWFEPHWLPTAGLIVSVWCAKAFRPQWDAVRLNRGFFWICVSLASLYMLLLAATLLLIPVYLSASTPEEFVPAIFDYLTLSNSWLGLVQALAATVMGALFISGAPGPSQTGDSASPGSG